MFISRGRCISIATAMLLAMWTRWVFQNLTCSSSSPLPLVDAKKHFNESSGIMNAWEEGRNWKLCKNCPALNSLKQEWSWTRLWLAPMLGVQWGKDAQSLSPNLCKCQAGLQSLRWGDYKEHSLSTSLMVPWTPQGVERRCSHSYFTLCSSSRGSMQKWVWQ